MSKHQEYSAEKEHKTTTACIKVDLEAEGGFPHLSYFIFVYVDLYIPYYHSVT